MNMVNLQYFFMYIILYLDMEEDSSHHIGWSLFAGLSTTNSVAKKRGQPRKIDKQISSIISEDSVPPTVNVPSSAAGTVLEIVEDCIATNCQKC